MRKTAASVDNIAGVGLRRVTMITGVHALLYSKEPEELRAWFRDVLGLSSVDARQGWPIFALPPAEMAVHPADSGGERHELFLMCDDLEATISELTAKGVEFATPVSEQRWGFLTSIRIPGGGELSLYQPKHPTTVK
jgi:catechol 2,3-dioxygenase-like lactoylglutathione lyase family enzyme